MKLYIRDREILMTTQSKSETMKRSYSHVVLDATLIKPAKDRKTIDQTLDGRS